MTDRKILRTITAATLAALLAVMFIPGIKNEWIFSAAILAPVAALICIFVKKRSLLSSAKVQVLLLFLGFGAVYLLIYYLTGIWLGFEVNVYRLNLENFFKFILPITLIIVSTELMRSVTLAGEDKLCDVLCYISSVIAQVLICGNIHYATSFNRFMDLVGLTLLPAILANLLYHYTARRYGCYPNIVFRLFSTLYLYLIPYVPAMPDSLFAIYNMAIPGLIYAFVDALYEKKRRYALEKKSRIGAALTVVTVVLMIGVILLISNKFRYGALVIATPSMTGELNVGDAAIFEKYNDQIIVEGQVIAFEKEGSVIVHRVVDIEKINNVTRYYTKGDANPDNDAGFVVDSEIVGLVNFKIPYVGYPTVWLRDLFQN